jgi:hypothetical protein
MIIKILFTYVNTFVLTPALPTHSYSHLHARICTTHWNAHTHTNIAPTRSHSHPHPHIHTSSGSKELRHVRDILRKQAARDSVLRVINEARGARGGT